MAPGLTAPFLRSGDPPAHRGRLTPSLPAPLQPPRKLHLTSLILPDHFLRPNSRRNHLAVATPSPVSSCFRRARPSASSPTDPTTPIASSPLAATAEPGLDRPPRRETSRRRAPLRRRRPPWETHLQSPPLPPKPTPGRALSSWCSWASPSPPLTPPLTGIWPAMPLPFLPRRARTQLL
jgi:hypothetical protein